MKKTTNAIRFETRVPLSEVMKRNPTMIGIEATVAMAAKAMCKEEVGSVIILDNNKPIGIVTEEDINCKVVAKDLKPSKVHVNEIMSTPLITVSADKTSGDAAHMMVKHKVRRLPVVDDCNEVIGIITVRDLLTVSTELNDLLEDLIEINREEIVEQGVCDRCSQMSDDLKRVDGVLICPSCREEDKIT
ncbi:MAG: CBS domain-containing protein [Methanomicrobiales archaeon HGW-Methanomicrobiales-1]|jgi:signal-transduction protein with cAMP-binding, CBS, and nucleotidyltransferase domain|nr:MAG: CBS domain-containing protein [Methanomicrobiales archaeon HGW-Methanomicrobiales-1]